MTYGYSWDQEASMKWEQLFKMVIFWFKVSHGKFVMAFDVCEKSASHFGCIRCACEYGISFTKVLGALHPAGTTSSTSESTLTIGHGREQGTLHTSCWSWLTGQPRGEDMDPEGKETRWSIAQRDMLCFMKGGGPGFWPPFSPQCCCCHLHLIIIG